MFDRVIVDHLVRGSTRVSWGLFYQFTDVDPWVFTLQVGETGNPNAADWQDVGPSFTNAFYAVDDTRRDFGAVRTVHYRVKLQTPQGMYFSPPAAVFGVLDLHDWLLAREYVRKEQLRHRLATVAGWLLKRRRTGTPPQDALTGDPRTAVVDPLTNEIVRREGPPAEATFGTEFLEGYYAPAPFSLDVTDWAYFDAQDPAMTTQTTNNARSTTARILMFPYVTNRDVFVAAHSDLRYELNGVKVIGSQHSVPLIGSVEAQLIPFSDIVYTIPVPPA